MRRTSLTKWAAIAITAECLWLAIVGYASGHDLFGVFGGGGLGLNPTVWADPETGTWTDAAIQFTAADKSWLQIADADQTGLDPGTDDFLICGWVYVDSLAAQRGVYSKGVDVDADPGFALRIFTNGTLYTTFGDGTGVRINTVHTPSPVIAAGAWYFFTAFYDRSASIRLVVHSSSGTKILDDSTAVISTQQGSVNSFKPFYLGSISIGDLPFDGRLDSFMFFKAADLSGVADDIISWAYNDGAGRLCSDITDEQNTAWGAISGWELGEAAGTRYDSWGSNHLDQAFANIISPTVNNGGFETLGAGGADVFGTWTEYAYATSTVNAESVAPYAGSYACRMDVDALGSLAGVRQDGFTSGKLYSYQLYAKASAACSLKVVNGDTEIAHTLTTDYAPYSGTLRVGSVNSRFAIYRNVATSKSIYVDNITLTATEILPAPGIVRGLCADGDTLSYWIPRVGNAITKESPFSARPLVASTGITQASVNGDGVDDTLTFPTTALEDGFAIIAVVQAAATPSSDTVCGNTSDDYVILTDDTTVTVSIDGTTQPFTVPSLGTDAHVLAVVRSDADIVQVFVDGAESSSGAQGLAGTFSLERLLSHGSDYGDLKLGNFLVAASALSAARRSRVEKVFATKHSITLAP